MSATDRPDELKDFPIVVTLPIQWGDMDAFGHVNNTVPIRWFESSRIAYLEQGGMRKLVERERIGPILASITCNYRSQLHYADTVHIGGRMAKLGRSSMTMEHAIFSVEKGKIAADGTSVIVVFDYDKQRPTRVPDDVRAAVEKLEGRSF